MDSIYDDITNIDLGDEVHKLEEQNKRLAEHICKLEGDIKRLCTEVANLKETQQNLTKNISELFKTAKLEIQRKDKIISELREEIDNMTFRRGFTSNKSKRPFPEAKNVEDSKRFKSNSYEDKNIVQISIKDDSPTRTNKSDIPVHKDKKDSSSSRSTPDSIKVDTHQHEDKKVSSSNKCYKNESLYKNSRYPSPTNFRRNMGSNIRRRPDNRCVRNRSSDRQGYRDRRNTERRSRSNERYGSNRKVDRYKRSRSNNRWQDNKDIELNNLHESIDSRYNRSRSKSLGRKRTPSRDLASDEHKLEHRRKNNYLHSQNSKSKSNEILDLTDDLEEGEITGESDNLVIEEPIQKTRYVTDDKTKSLTIEEYRNRKKTVTNTEAKESNILSQVTVKESIEKLTDTNRIIKKEPSKNSEDCHEHLIPKIETGYESNTHTENIENTEMVFKNVIKSEDALKPSTEDIKPIIEDIPVKNCKEESEKTENTCERNKQLNDSSLNDSTNSTSKLFSGDDSRFSNDSSIAGNNESTSSHNNSINTSIRQRRRRCVVIGLKVKA